MKMETVLQLPAGSPSRVNRSAGMMQRLGCMMSLIWNGEERDLVTPLCPRDRSEVIEEVRFVTELDRLPLWLREVEFHQMLKAAGSHSTRRPGMDPFATGLSAYASIDSATPDGSSSQAATRVVFEKLQSIRRNASYLGLTPVSLGEASASFEGRTGLGWPYCSSKVEYLGDCLKYSGSLLDRIIGMRSMSTNSELPFIMGTRSSPTRQGEDPKWRIISQDSRVMANILKMFQMPVTLASIGCKHFEAWTGKRAVDSAVTRLLDQGWCLSVDFQNFDATVPAHVVHCVFGLIQRMFGPEQWVARVFRYAEEHFLTSPLVTPTGLITGRTKGIPSGSNFTNLVGSLANIWVIAYGAHRLGYSVADCTVQGDDGVYVFRNNYGTQAIDIEALADVIHSDLGMRMHPDKQFYAPNEVHFLQNVHRKSYTEGGLCVGIRPIMRVLSGMLSYDRHVSGWNGYLDTIRWWQQLENASAHPKFRNICAWLLERDKHSRHSVESLVSKAGGWKHVTQVLGGRTEWNNKVPLASLANSRTAMEMSRLLV